MEANLPPNAGNTQANRETLDPIIPSVLAELALSTETTPSPTRPSKTDALDKIIQATIGPLVNVNPIDNLPVVPTTSSWRANTPPLEEAGSKKKYHTGFTLDAAAYTLHHLKKYRLTQQQRH